jgi:hypothetical protein
MTEKMGPDEEKSDFAFLAFLQKQTQNGDVLLSENLPLLRI